jgi:hypothetical protein
VRDFSVNTTGANVGNNPNATDPTQMPPGDNTLITIYTRTGQVSAHPVDPTGLQLPPGGVWNPFRFTQDARSSGGQ